MRARRTVWLIGSLSVAVLFGGRTARGQSFTVTPSNTSANIVPTPTSAVYTAGTSASTPSWTIVASCPNGAGPAGSRCPFSIASSIGTLASTRVSVAAPVGSGCTGSAASYALQSSPTELFSVARGNGNSCTTTLTFAVTGVSLTAYPSASSIAASTFTRSVQLVITCLRSGGNAC